MITTILFLFTFLVGYAAGVWTLVAILNEDRKYGYHESRRVRTDEYQRAD
jgi:hypothetical protein